MTEAVNDIIANADYFVLLMFRVGGLIFSSPIFGRTNIPNSAKLGLVGAVGYLFFIAFPQSAPIVYTSLVGYVLICVMELLLGIALAYVTNVFFTLTYTAGQMIDQQIGFSIVSVYDPQNRTQVPVFGNVLNLMLLLVFFSADGHHRLIELVYLTLSRMPVGGLTLSREIGWTALEVFSKAFMMGIMVALPVLASGLTLELILGILMRAVPQIHMFVVGVPLKLIIGLVVVLTTLPVFANFSGRIFSEMYGGMEKMFSAFIEAG